MGRRRTRSIDAGPWRLGAAAAILVSALVQAPAAEGLRAEGQIRIALRSEATAGGPFILLDEIADLSSGPPGLRAFAGAILFGFSPEEGAKREIGASEVEARLRQSGIPDGWYTIEGAPRASVSAEETGGEDSPDGRIGGTAGSEETAPAEEKEDEVAAPAKSPSAPEGGRLPAVRDARPAVREGRAPLQMRPISIEDVRKSFKNREPLPARKAAPVAAPRSPASTRASGQAAASERLPAETNPPAGRGFSVAKGEPVMISTDGEAMILSEAGQALEAAEAGEVLLVKNLRTGRKVLGRLVARGTVILESMGDEGRKKGG
jgi:hypothetical protein